MQTKLDVILVRLVTIPMIIHDVKSVPMEHMQPLLVLHHVVAVNVVVKRSIILLVLSVQPVSILKQVDHVNDVHSIHIHILLVHAHAIHVKLVHK